MSTKDFVRLPGRRFGVIRRASVWDAGDYLLSVSGTTFSERYRRFYYRDIKAMVVQKGPRLGSIGAMLLTLWCSLPLLIIAVGPVGSSVAGGLLLLPLLWLGWLIYVNLARSCRVLIFTAVSSEELPAIFRRRSAAKAVPMILSKIAEAQGQITGVVSDAEQVVIENAANVEVASAPVSNQILYAAGIFSLLFLVSAAFAYWYRGATWNSAAQQVAKVFLPVQNAAEVGTGVWALFKLFRVRVMNSLRICIFAGLALLAVRSYAFLFLFSLLAQQNSLLNQAFSKIQVRFWIGTFDSGLSLIVGLAGLITLMLIWQGADTEEPVSNL